MNKSLLIKILAWLFLISAIVIAFTSNLSDIDMLLLQVQTFILLPLKILIGFFVGIFPLILLGFYLHHWLRKNMQ